MLDVSSRPSSLHVFPEVLHARIRNEKSQFENVHTNTVPRQRGFYLFLWPTIKPPPRHLVYARVRYPVDAAGLILQQVNLSATTRETIISHQQQQQKAVEAEAGSSSASVKLFAEAWDEVSKLLQRDAFAQFRHTEAFLRLKREWDEEVSFSGRN